MKMIRNLLLKRLTIGNTLNLIGTFIFAILLKFLIEHYNEISPIRGGLTTADIS